MWERGLKQWMTEDINQYAESLPMWMRALDRGCIKEPVDIKTVAPHVGAWIETHYQLTPIQVFMVAPHVGAWIETSPLSCRYTGSRSLPMWERGLKQTSQLYCAARYASLPMWERGLKHS